eukprot:351491-Chlamydomonas_euryale.AAC.8
MPARMQLCETRHVPCLCREQRCLRSGSLLQGAPRRLQCLANPASSHDQRQHAGIAGMRVPQRQDDITCKEDPSIPCTNSVRALLRPMANEPRRWR